MPYIFRIIILLSLFTLSATAATQRPNFLFIMLDDMGYGDLQCYNPSGNIPTPNIDGLAAQGMKFTDAHSAAGTCIPSRFGLLTGCYPIEARSYVKTIRKGRETIATLLKKEGYNTAMVGKWHNGFWNWDDRGNTVPAHIEGGPYGCGFDYYFGIPHSLDQEPYLYVENNYAVGNLDSWIAASDSVSEGWTNIQGVFWREGPMVSDFQHDQVLGDFTNKAVEYLQNYSSPDPFFLYVAMAGPHTPWMPSPAFVGQSGAGMYGDFLMEIDARIGDILQALDNMGAASNTLVCLTSDNGPVWYPDDVQTLGHSSTGQWRGMKGDLFEGGHRVPFIAKWPGQIPANSTCDELVSLTDMMATYADVLNATLESDAGVDSVSMLPLMLGGTSPVRNSLIHVSNFLAFRTGNYKYLEKRGSGGFTQVQINPGDPIAQLYDVTDPNETNNLYDTMPTTVNDLKAQLDTIKAVPTTNLIQNPSFEDGTNSWNIGNTAQRSNANAHDDNYSLLITQPSSATTQSVTTVPGTTYLLSVRVDASGLTGGKVVFDTNDEYDGGIPEPCQFVIDPGDANGWTQFTGSFTAADTGVTLRIFSVDAATAGTVYFDNIIIAPESYDSWAAVTDTDYAFFDDDDDDKSNLYEYAFNGNPQSESNTGIEPSLIRNGNNFEFRHLLRKNDSSLSYTLQESSDLINWTTASSVVSNTAHDNHYDEITHTIPATNSRSFIRLKVED